jgi:hypothetical protein
MILYDKRRGERRKKRAREVAKEGERGERKRVERGRFYGKKINLQKFAFGANQ